MTNQTTTKAGGEQLDRSDVVSAIVQEYKLKGKQAAISLFDSMIKKYGISQWAIKTIIIEFRKAI